MERKQRLNQYIEDAIKEYWSMPALADIAGERYSYRDCARKIAKMHIIYDTLGIKPGDRIAICGRNSSIWCIAFLSIITYGAVAVPILPDFKPEDIARLLNHSESRVLFADAKIWNSIKEYSLPLLDGVASLKDLSLLYSGSEELTHARKHLNALFGQKYPEKFEREDVKYYEEKPDELCLISYTSGSTGHSKGVMLPYRSLWSNIEFCFDRMPTNPGDSVVYMLPLAHMYGLTCDMLRSFVSGNYIRILMRPPSPKIVASAMKRIKPRYVITVPLVLEKIIKAEVFPVLEKPLMKILVRVPIVDKNLMRRIKQGLLNTFGGNLKEIMIGGAALNKDVERFLDKCGFPYSAGYGMTECGPFIAYAPTEEHRVGSCGKIVDRMEARILSKNPEKIAGVLEVKGDNVMLGYYKNPEATENAMHDGWLRTGDICTLDRDGFLYIKGRDKNMILGPSGQNIYPEEIEDKLNNMPYVQESLVVDAGKGKLMAIIVPDVESAKSQKFNIDDLRNIMKENLKQLNAMLPKYSQVHDYKFRSREFEKTPKNSIKRYLYSPKQN